MKSVHVVWSAIVAALLVASPAFARSGHGGGGGHSRGSGAHVGHVVGGTHLSRGAIFHGGHRYRPYFVGGVFFGYSCWDCGYPAYWYSGDYPGYPYPYAYDPGVPPPPPSPAFDVSPDAARDGEANDDSSPADRHNMGLLSLAVRPRDAAIYIDGEPRSGAARRDVELRAGTHHIEVVRPGYQPFARDVTIQPGQTSEIDVHLDAK
jgi:hypothetical protein